MILRRIIEHVKVQNWTAIAIDFVIVVVGVFIGLQVNNWNEARNERKSERSYLERLAGDMDQDAIALKEAIGQAEERAQAASFLLAAIEDPSVAASAPCRFLGSITLAQYSGWPVLNRQTYQELVSTGGLSLIRDAELKTKVGQYYAEFDAGGQYTEQFRQIALEFSDAVRGVWTIGDRRALAGALNNPRNETCGITAKSALEARNKFLARDGAIDWLPTLEGRQNGFATRLKQSLKSANFLADRLHRTLGKSS